MHAGVVKVTINDAERAEAGLHEQVVPNVSQAPGFVAGYWMRSDDNTGMSVVVFESEENARGFAQRMESEGPPNDAVTVDSVEVREVVASA